MARVVVVGGGFGGLASAARLAKLGHEVTLVERSPSLGGALSFESEDGFTWDAGPTSTLLPAVIRDLFRKSGRPLERELDLEPLAVVREHRFEDGTSVRLPGGSRGRADRGVRRARPRARASAGSTTSASYADDWEMLRRGYLEGPWDPDAPARASWPRCSTAARCCTSGCKRTFKDERLRLVAGHPFVADGHDLRNVPAWLGVTAYVEQRFGAWTVPGGMAGLGDGAARTGWRRARSRVLTDTDGRRPRGPRRPGRGGRRPRPASSTPTSSCARSTRAGCRRWRRTSSGRCRRSRRSSRHLGLEGDAARPRRTRWCCTATRCSSCAPAAGRPTAPRRGPCTAAASSPRTSCARWPGTRSTSAPQVVARVDRSPRDLVERWGGSPDRRAVAGPRHRPPAARPDHPDPRRVRRRRARHPRRRAAVRRPLGGSGRPGRRARGAIVHDDLSRMAGSTTKRRGLSASDQLEGHRQRGGHAWSRRARSRPPSSRRTPRWTSGVGDQRRHVRDALADHLQLAERGAGEVRRGARPAATASAYAASRASAPGGVRVGDLERDPVDLQPVADLGGQRRRPAHRPG